MNAGELFYFCPGCKKFHFYGGHDIVSRNLCFVCGNESNKRTKIIEDLENEKKLQICESCLKIYDTSGFKLLKIK